MLIEEIKNKIENMDKEVLVLETENNVVEKDIIELKEKNKKLLEQLQKSVDAVKFVEEVAFSRRSVIKDKIETVITEALKNVYGKDYSIVFDYSIKNSRTAVNIILVKKTLKGDLKRVLDGKGDGSGGGVFDTIALPLKLLVLLASKKADKILFTDEPGKHIDEDRIQRFAGFIKEISNKLNVQIFMFSHHRSVVDYADTVFEFSCEDSINTTVKKIK